MFADTEVAQDILSRRYYAHGETKPHHLLARVARAISSPEEDQGLWEKKFYHMMNNGDFLPNSPCLVNAGRGGGLFACFVIGVDDNIESIGEAKTHAMKITKSGGGWGIGLSNLRAEGSPVSGSTHGIAGGPIGFWETFSYDMRTMTQGGFRDAACMATLADNHPDIIKFINAKEPTRSLVRLLNLERVYGNEGDAFAAAKKLLDNNEELRAAAETYMSNFNISVLISDETMENNKALVWQIAENAHKNGEPGILFIDKIRERTRYDPGLINATNPCGEQPLPPNGSCCLGSINLSNFVLYPGEGSATLATLNDWFDFPKFVETVKAAVRFLDNMITLNEFPSKETEAWSKEHRSIGLGIMGYADMLVKMGLWYGSLESIRVLNSILGALRRVAENASQDLQQEKGDNYPGWGGRRNHALLSIAPTGSISLLAGCSAGIEPIYSKSIIRKDQTGTHQIDHPLADMDSFVTLEEVSWGEIIDTVAQASKWIDTSISYTVNFPGDASVEEVYNAIRYAHDTGCNGITVYRDGSRNMQVLNRPDEKKEMPTQVVEADDRPAVLEGATFKYAGYLDGETTNLYVTVNQSEGRPWEVFINTPNIQSMPELQLVTAVTRLSSLALRYNAPVSQIIKQLRRVEGQSITSVPAVISRALAHYVTAEEKAGDCPECGEMLVHTGGCAICSSCGYSICG